MTTINSVKQQASMPRRLRVLFVTLGDPQNTRISDVVVRLRAAGVDCDQLVMPYQKRWKRLIKALWCARRVANYNVVITNEYNNGFVFTLVGQILKNNAKNIIIGMNLSGRALKIGVKPIDKAISAVFQHLDRVVVHSREEIDLFVRLHGISRDKFTFSSWGFDAPSASGPTAHFNSDTPRYFCMIGRNNRDFTTFSAAIASCDVDGVIVCDKDEKIVASATSRLKVFHNLSMEECAACVRYSLANVILVHDANRGAGHITAVMGMQFAKPHIFTDVPTLRDYLVPDKHGIGVHIGDVPEVTRAMVKLLHNAELADRLGQTAQIEATIIHSHEAAQNRVFDVIKKELDF